MKHITQTTVASGVIGQHNHEWTIIKLYDKKYDSESYELFINEEHIASLGSVVEALTVLVDQFCE